MQVVDMHRHRKTDFTKFAAVKILFLSYARLIK